jgi:hypothetical protein
MNAAVATMHLPGHRSHAPAAYFFAIAEMIELSSPPESSTPYGIRHQLAVDSFFQGFAQGANISRVPCHGII